MGLELNDSENKLQEIVEQRLLGVKLAIQAGGLEKSNIDKLFKEMSENAHQLHMKLKSRGEEPRHHSYMIENRELEPDHEKFYEHVHPVEDLLAFIDDPHANDDPEDQTIGHKFEIKIYSRRWGHDDFYRLTRTATGWDVRLNHSGTCDKGGQPFLFEYFDNDSVDYPANLRGRLEWLWNKASEQGLSHKDVQEALTQLANWVNATSQGTPSGGVWAGY